MGFLDLVGARARPGTALGVREVPSNGFRCNENTPPASPPRAPQRPRQTNLIVAPTQIHSAKPASASRSIDKRYMAGLFRALRPRSLFLKYRSLPGSCEMRRSRRTQTGPGSQNNVVLRECRGKLVRPTARGMFFLFRGNARRFRWPVRGPGTVGQQHHGLRPSSTRPRKNLVFLSPRLPERG